MQRDQIQELVFALPESQNSQIYDDISVGIIQHLENPYNLFLRLGQLLDASERFVYFFIYSMGMRRIVLWGAYDKRDESFNIESGCRYSPNQLYKTTMYWKNNGYSYIGNTVRDRPHEIIGRELGQKRMDDAQYKQKKYLIGYLDGKITQRTYEKIYGPITNYLPEDDYDLYDFQLDLEQELADYEENINSKDITITGLEREIIQLLKNIMEQFHDAVARGDINTAEYEQMLDDCPNYQKCRDSVDDSCAFYYYGDKEIGMLYKDDLGDELL